MLYSEINSSVFESTCTNKCRSYDVRVVAGVYEFDEEQVPADVNETAEIIVKSMKRSTNNIRIRMLLA